MLNSIGKLGIAVDLRISDMFEMQKQLHALHPEWGGNKPELGRDKMLWCVGEIGEAAQILKKLGNHAVMEDPNVREHFVEEISDVFMYLYDILLCYDVTPEEYSRIHAEKFARNTKRDFTAEHDHIFDKKDL